MQKARSKEYQTVSSKEFQRNFSTYQHNAAKEPVLVTKYNKERFAFISIEEFEEYQILKKGARMSIHVNELSEKDFQTIMDAEIPPEHDPEKK